MKSIVALFLAFSFIGAARSYNSNHLPADLERAMRICIVQADGFGKAYIIETLNEDLTTIKKEVYFKALDDAKRAVYKEVNDKGIVEKACMTVANVYTESTNDEEEGIRNFLRCSLK